MALYKTDIPFEINELLKKAAARNGRSKEKHIHKLFEAEAKKEKKLQEGEKR